MMIVLLMLLGFVAVAAGMFGLGLGVPVRDTTFGSAVLVASSVAITGGLILVGLAIAVAELRKALQAAMRQQPERREAERSRRASWPEPRIGASAAAGGAFGADAAEVIPTRFDAPGAFEEADTEAVRVPVDEEPFGVAKPRRAPAFPSGAAQQEKSGRDHAASELRRQAAPPFRERFDAIRPSDFRKPDAPGEDAGQREADGTGNGGAGPGEVRSPPLSPAESAAGAIRPVKVLKSGMINDVAYTLFSDGSIETQTTDGLKRFGSIDEFRRHLEKSAG